MDAVTHPDRLVIETIERDFVPLRVNTAKLEPQFRDLLRTTKPQWAPMMLIVDPSSTELRHWFGWLQPGAFIGELHMALAAQRMLRRDFEEAERLFRGVAAMTPERETAAEALFFAGAARYRVARDLDALEQQWNELRERFPETSWARKADVFDMRER